MADEAGEMGSMIKRSAFNALLFSLLLAGIGVFTRMRTGAPDVADVVVASLLGGAWAGILVAIVEVKLVTLTRARRLAVAAGCGALAYLGLFVAMARLAGIELRPDLLAIGATLGAVSHAVRASLGSREELDDDNG